MQKQVQPGIVILLSFFLAIQAAFNCVDVSIMVFQSAGATVPSLTMIK